jgi:hypothetical protein
MHAHNKRASKHTSQNWIEVKEERNRCDDLLSVEIFHCYKILNTISQLDPNITHTPPHTSTAEGTLFSCLPK